MSKSDKYSQPFLLCLGAEGNPSEFFIVADELVLPAGEDIIAAFDRLYKLHFVFNIEYASPLLHFYQFFDSMVYETLSIHKIRPMVRSFSSKLSAFLPETEST